VVADYSPGALFALRGTPIRKVNVGLGFFCPPDGFPLPHWLPKNLMAYHPRLIQKEHRLTQLANKILSDRHRPPLQRLSRIHNDVDEVFLATYPEFDHFGERPGMRYWGHWPFGIGIDPIWPAGNGPKIYCYLKPFPALEALLAHLRHRGTPTIVFAGGIDPKVQAQFSSPSMRFENSPLDLCKVTTQCDVAITHAGHGTTVSFLLAGKPCLVVPRFVEQGLFAEKIERHSVGRMVLAHEGPRFAKVLDELLGDGKYRAGAQTLAAKYAGFTPGGQIPELADHLERLLVPHHASDPNNS
jgi:UDP:flavonoid glycosyltransferase YjiC (YdhE family)